ncbi:MAG TPA: hypothetical protein VHA75_11535, partial [Rugosimonospora sp.]|nr:hypothetical protein [Rugosimonospora sp.]
DHKKSSKKDLDAIGDAFNDTAGRIVGAFDWISSRVTSALHAVRDAARDAFNQVSRIPGFSALGSLIGKYFHDGGITSGGIRYAAAGLTTFGPNSGAVYSRPVYGIAEPGTGGELFMPRFGNQQRQQMLAGVAAAWAGGAYVPAQQVGSPVATIPTDSMQPSIVHVHLMVDGKELGKGAVLDLRAVSAAAAAGDRLSNATNTGRRR